MDKRLTFNAISQNQGVHLHDYSQLLFGWHGALALEFDAGGDHLRRGLFSVIPSGYRHEYQGLSEDCAVIVVDLPPLGMSPEQPSLVTTPIADHCPTAAPSINRLSDGMYKLLEYYDQTRQNIKDGNFTLERHLSELLLLEIASSNLAPRTTSPVSLTQRARRSLDRHAIEEYVDSNLHLRISSADLARLTCMSVSYFHAQFKEQFHLTPQAFILERRLTKARYFLDYSNRTITDIAYSVGFADVSSFSRAFKTNVGLSPTIYRDSTHG